MPLFEVAVITKPTKKEIEDGAVEQLVFGPEAIIARDSQTAAIKALKAQSESLDLDRSEVIVRPF